jgi:hypothetical protein
MSLRLAAADRPGVLGELVEVGQRPLRAVRAQILDQPRPDMGVAGHQDCVIIKLVAHRVIDPSIKGHVTFVLRSGHTQCQRLR